MLCVWHSPNYSDALHLFRFTNGDNTCMYPTTSSRRRNSQKKTSDAEVIVYSLIFKSSIPLSSAASVQYSQNRSETEPPASDVTLHCVRTQVCTSENVMLFGFWSASHILAALHTNTSLTKLPTEQTWKCLQNIITIQNDSQRAFVNALISCLCS